MEGTFFFTLLTFLLDVLHHFLQIDFEKNLSKLLSVLGCVVLQEHEPCLYLCFYTINTVKLWFFFLFTCFSKHSV